MSETLADQALANLVKQFARPLDFLRELVQNSIDAGSPRVEVWVDFQPSADDHEQGVLEVHVDDFGEGMDEHIIESQLTRLFSSTKEDDLTKIGKFGIGFTSIFAIEPDVVVVRTGRHGESWELVFHPDRSFDQARLDEAVTGTGVALYKRVAADEVAGFVCEARWVLGHWCEHSETPITFQDRTVEVEEAAPVAEASPFAAFAQAPAGPPIETVSRPLALEAPLVLTLDEDGVEVRVGYSAVPRYGYYNGGLTLVSTRNPDVLGDRAEALGHLTFKLRHNLLEHTLTRDNVLFDTHWEHAMIVLERAADALWVQLLDRLEQAVQAGEDLRSWHHHLAAECRARRSARKDMYSRPVLRDSLGRPLSLAKVEHQEADQGFVLLDAEGGALARALEVEGLVAVADAPETREVLRATAQRWWLVGRTAERTLAQAGDVFVLPQPLEMAQLDPRESALVKRTAAQLQEAVGDRIRLKVGDFGGLAEAPDVLALEGPEQGGVFRREGTRGARLPFLLRLRCLLVNRHHRAFQAWLVAAEHDPELAAFGLAQALLHVEEAEWERSYHLLMGAAVSGGAA